MDTWLQQILRRWGAFLSFDYFSFCVEFQVDSPGDFKGAFERNNEVLKFGEL
jgi:hypothetical protein